MGTQQIDLFITQTSLLANTIGAFGLGFSTTAAFLILSLCVYTSGAGLADSLTAYGTFSLPENFEVADFYVRSGLIQTGSALVGAPFWSWIFSVIIRTKVLPLGLPFWMCAGFYAASIVGVKALRSFPSRSSEGSQYSPLVDRDDRD